MPRGGPGHRVRRSRVPAQPDGAGTEAGDELQLVDDPSIAGTPCCWSIRASAIDPGVFAAWDGVDRGPLGDWREGRNDLEAPARSLVPDIGEVLDWLKATGRRQFVRMSGSGATCFALFDGEAARDAAAACPLTGGIWRLFCARGGA